MQPPSEQALYQERGKDNPPRDNLQAARPTSSDETPAQRTLCPAQEHVGVDAGGGFDHLAAKVVGSVDAHLLHAHAVG